MVKVKNKSNGVESEFTNESWNAVKKDPRWSRVLIETESVKPIEIRKEDPIKPKAEAEVKSKAVKARTEEPVARPEEPIK